MSPWELGLLAVAGVAGGWLNVVAGGGSLLTVPLMVFLGLPGPVANGTNRIAILFQNIAAVATFRQRGFSDFRLSLTLALAASFGALFGAHAGVRLDGEWFDRVVAAVMLAVLVLMWRERPPASGNETGATARPRRLIAGHLLMVGAGFWGGFIQLGVGFLLMPVLHRVMGLDLVRTNMHKVFIVTAYTLVALAVFASQLELMWWVGAWLALGNAVGGWLGAHSSIDRGEPWIRRVLQLTLLAFVFGLLFF